MNVIARLSLPFEGLPVLWAGLFWIALIVILVMMAWAVVLFVRGQRVRRRPPPDADADDFTWVFMVPALDEEVTIADSVERLLELELEHRHIVVIDDGSEDRTGEIVTAIGHSDIHLLQRRPPHAREGKAAALNYAYHQLADRLGPDVDRANVIVCIVDADGRLHHDAPALAASHFADPIVGGVQSLVRIYNRHRLLTWMQDVEFSVYGFLFQAGRNDWGTAGMGGNGQFNRLVALDSIADQEGPWRDKLTEDQDLGLRLITTGWQGQQELRAVVSQQGLSNLRALFRQRTRWSQGNLQAISLSAEVAHAGRPLIARIETLIYLLMPFWQAIVGASLIAAIALAFFGVADFWDDISIWQLLFIYLLGFGGTMMGCIAARSPLGPLGWLRGFVLAHLYAFYSWLLWPVLVRSALRQLIDRDSWAKTEREPIKPSASPGAP